MVFKSQRECCQKKFVMLFTFVWILRSYQQKHVLTDGYFLSLLLKSVFLKSNYTRMW